jgi:hypothetical protein
MLSKPTKEITRVFLSAGTVRVKFPSELVWVATVVPFTETVAPKIGCLSASLVTLPETERCAKAKVAKNSKQPVSHHRITVSFEGINAGF